MLDDELRHNGLNLDDMLDEEITAPVLKRLCYATMDDLYAAIGYNGIAVARAANRLRDEYKARSERGEKKTVLDKVAAAADRREQSAKKLSKPVQGVLVEGLDNCLIKFSRCCTPVPGDEIIGFITRGQGVSIHRKDCPNYLQRSRDAQNEGRWIRVAWAAEISESYVTSISIASKDRSGLVMDIAKIGRAHV